jgi:type IV pilus assembly protein PilF
VIRVGVSRVSTAVMISLALIACAGESTKNHDEHQLSQKQQAAAFNTQLGTDYFRQGDWVQAKEKLERALEQDPRNVTAHMVAGLLYDRLGEQDKAEAHLQRAVALDEKNAETRNAYAAYLCGHGKFAAGEKNALTAAAEPLYKTPEAALFNAGNCARLAGDSARAEKHLRRALELQPRFAPALLEMADLEHQAKNYMAARAFLERYFSATEATSTALLLGVRIETALGNRSVAADYARRLRNDFTTSDEAKALAEIERGGH